MCPFCPDPCTGGNIGLKCSTTISWIRKIKYEQEQNLTSCFDLQALWVALAPSFSVALALSIPLVTFPLPLAVPIPVREPIAVALAICVRWVDPRARRVDPRSRELTERVQLCTKMPDFVLVPLSHFAVLRLELVESLADNVEFVYLRGHCRGAVDASSYIADRRIRVKIGASSRA